MNSFKQEKYFRWLWKIIGLGEFARIKTFLLQHQRKVKLVKKNFMTASRKVKSNPAMVQIEIIDGKILSAIA